MRAGPTPLLTRLNEIARVPSRSALLELDCRLGQVLAASRRSWVRLALTATNSETSEISTTQAPMNSSVRRVASDLAPAPAAGRAAAEGSGASIGKAVAKERER
ncbi:hypothetical protein [Luteimonas notoginsengisoli]|uniref:Uncharacterized protein n=1 Tax=Luteimonas notoginsengisoli TaxID=1578200 RepID=A0ABV7UTZ5_9GAMM